MNQINNIRLSKTILEIQENTNNLSDAFSYSDCYQDRYSDRYDDRYNDRYND